MDEVSEMRNLLQRAIYMPTEETKSFQGLYYDTSQKFIDTVVDLKIETVEETKEVKFG